MKYYFSKTEGFQNDDVHSIALDAVELTDQEHVDLMKGQEIGKTIDFDLNGKPILLDIPTLDFSQIKASKLEELNRAFESKVALIKISYTLSEVQTWDKQETEARSYLLDPIAPTPLLTSLAVARGILLEELVNKVILKADLFTEAIGTLIGIRQKLEKEIEIATTVEDIDLIISVMTDTIITTEENL